MEKLNEENFEGMLLHLEVFDPEFMIQCLEIL